VFCGSSVGAVLVGAPYYHFKKSDGPQAPPTTFAAKKSININHQSQQSTINDQIKRNHEAPPLIDINHFGCCLSARNRLSCTCIIMPAFTRVCPACYAKNTCFRTWHVRRSFDH
jgi:hypothetical protein